MIRYSTIKDLAMDCISLITDNDEFGSIVCDYETANELVNYIIKNTDYTLVECVMDGSEPVTVDIFGDKEVSVFPIINDKGKYMSACSDYCMIAREFADAYAEDNPNDSFITFVVTDREENSTDWTVCVHEDKKGFCYCRTTKYGDFSFSYRGNEVLTDNDIHRILEKYYSQ